MKSGREREMHHPSKGEQRAPRPHSLTHNSHSSFFKDMESSGKLWVHTTHERVKKLYHIPVTPLHNGQMGIFSGRLGSWITLPGLSLDGSSIQVSDLKRVLLSECNLDSIRKVCQGKPLPDTLRAEIWQICLSINARNEEPWDEIFDLPEQPVIRKDCQSLVDRLGNEDEDKFGSLFSSTCNLKGTAFRNERCRQTIYNSVLQSS
ncbi:UNVERIFIED_CONTAM: TBC1 domain family member 23 [Trichonephila clavipes]